MASFENVTAAIRKELARIEKQFDKTEPLMRVLANMGRASAKDAFINQRLGSISWPERYPNQTGPFINIAGALQDFNDGKSAPKPGRFDRRPALITNKNTGGLFDSIAAETKGPFVASWGSNRPYASLHQTEGSESKQPVTDTAKKKIREYIDKANKAEKKAFKASDVGKVKAKTKRRWNIIFGDGRVISTTSAARAAQIKQQKKYAKRNKTKDPTYKNAKITMVRDVISTAEEVGAAKMAKHSKAMTVREQASKLGFLLGKDELVTKLNWRPFLGITDELEKDMISAVKDYFEKHTRKSGPRGGA